MLGGGSDGTGATARLEKVLQMSGLPVTRQFYRRRLGRRGPAEYAVGSEEVAMREWLIVGVLYAFNLALFRWLGGFGSAGRAFRDWGRWSTTGRRDESSASSS
jgi:hypothetical protein